MIFIFGYIIIETELLKDGTTFVSYVMLKIIKNGKLLQSIQKKI